MTSQASNALANRPTQIPIRVFCTVSNRFPSVDDAGCYRRPTIVVVFFPTLTRNRTTGPKRSLATVHLIFAEFAVELSIGFCPMLRGSGRPSMLTWRATAWILSK
jgi:hypothetical protein